MNSFTLPIERKRPYNEAMKLEPSPSSNAFADGKDSLSLPRELTEKFGPLHCKLCNTTASSTVSAKIHYAGKPHRKNIRRFLEDWCRRTGEPMPKLSKPEEVELRQDVTFCKVCNLVLTSVSNAQEHYAGKNHLKTVRRNLLNNETTPKKIPTTAVDPTGRFGIGTAFLKPEDRTKLEQKQQKTEEKQEKRDLWACELCNVRAHTKDQLQIHLEGSKHMKAVKRSQAPSIVPAPVNPSESILASVIRPADSCGTDYSMHRTPSGNYYCQCCNVTVNSPEQFGQHIDSKKHKFMYASTRKPMSKNDRLPS